MANKTKKCDKVIKEMLEELAIGKSLRAVLSPKNKDPNRPCWETFRSWMKKDIDLRKEYEVAKTDGIEYLLSDATDTINEALENSKFKEKTAFGIRFISFNCEVG
tara:strand:+ start:712 stop:1026 length:315 start_codon:yes stop_codon:yes gene_type:complete